MVLPDWGVVSASYFLCGIMDTLVGSLRGIGYSLMPMFVSLTGACLFRIIGFIQYFKFSIHSSHCIFPTLYPGS